MLNNGKLQYKSEIYIHLHSKIIIFQSSYFFNQNILQCLCVVRQTKHNVTKLQKHLIAQHLVTQADE